MAIKLIKDTRHIILLVCRRLISGTYIKIFGSISSTVEDHEYKNLKKETGPKRTFNYRDWKIFNVPNGLKY